jgi:hypothetical protein
MLKNCDQPGITDALGEMAVPEHVGHLRVFVIDHIVLSNKRQRRLVVNVGALALYFLMRLGEQCGRLAPAMAPFLRRATRRCAVFSARSTLRCQPG